MHDTFITAYRKLDQLRDPSRLRSWLFAIARNEALSHGRKQKKAVPTEELEVTAASDGPDRLAETEELRELVWAAAAGLADRDRAALDLHLRQGLEGAALGEALGTSANNANVLMSRLRDQVERSLGAYLVAKKGRADCAALSALLEGWDGEFNPLWRKRIARHVEDCPTCSETRRRMVSPLALLAGVAVVPAPLALRDRGARTTSNWSARPRPIDQGRRRRIAAGVVAAAAGLASWPASPRCATKTRRRACRAWPRPRRLTRSSMTPTVADDTTTTGEVAGTTATTRRTATTQGGRPTATTRRPTVSTTTPPTTGVAAAILGAGDQRQPQYRRRRFVFHRHDHVDHRDGHRGRATHSCRQPSSGSGPGSTSGSKRLNGSGSTYSGTLGPLFGRGTATWWVTATDSTGARGQSPTQSISVTPCN